MLGLGGATKIYLALGVTDMRKSYDGLYGLVKGTLEMDPLSGHLFVFCNRRRDRIKALYWDTTGLWVLAKRLESGHYAWPSQASGASVELSYQELNLLLGGLDLSQTQKRKWY